jgi:predicted nucleic acid-binding protein
VLWLQVRKKLLSASEAREGLVLLRAQVEPTPTAALALHDVALDIAVNHSTCDTLYVAFAIAVGAKNVVVADGPFVRAMRAHPEPIVAKLPLPLSEWSATSRAAGRQGR